MYGYAHSQPYPKSAPVVWQLTNTRVKAGLLKMLTEDSNAAMSEMAKFVTCHFKTE
jgi:hypothetical protein